MTNIFFAKELDISYYLSHKETLWNSIVILYVFGGYCGAITLLLLPNIWLNIWGVVLLTHSVVL